MSQKQPRFEHIPARPTGAQIPPPPPPPETWARATVPLAVAQRLVRSAAVLTRAAPAAGLRVRGLGLVQDQRGTRLVVDYAPAEVS